MLGSYKDHTLRIFWVVGYPPMRARVVVGLVAHAIAHVAAAPAVPVITLDSGTFIGTTDLVTDKFLGIPFAQPPYDPSFSHLTDI